MTLSHHYSMICFFMIYIALGIHHAAGDDPFDDPFDDAPLQPQVRRAVPQKEQSLERLPAQSQANPVGPNANEFKGTVIQPAEDAVENDEDLNPLSASYITHNSRKNELRRLMGTKIRGAIEFDEQPLDIVIETISDAAGVFIAWDAEALSEKLDTDNPPVVTAVIKDVTVQNALDRILGQIDSSLRCGIKNNTVTITTEESHQFMTRVYGVRDLVRFKDEDEQSYSHPEPLISLIVKLIQPDSWDDLGGDGQIAFFEASGVDVLIVSQTDDVHKQILALLSTVRRLRNPEEYEQGPRKKQKLDAKRIGETLGWPGSS